MSCSNPLKAFQIGINPETGKKIQKICSYKTHHIEFHDNRWIPIPTDEISPKVKSITEYVEIPCGKCNSCKMNKAKQWTLRCMLELKKYDPKECWFLTLTYDNEHLMQLPQGMNDLYSLRMKDVQLFWKRLRKRVFEDYGRNIRFYACGEYGDQSLRPHYHAIVYNLPLFDIVKVGLSKTHNPIYDSKYIENIWKKGLVRVANVTIETCAYVARYVTKKNYGIKVADFTLDYGLESEFTVMSRRPGIARDYYEERAPSIYDTDSIYINGQIYKPPKYFDKLYEIEYPDELEKVKKNRREFAENNQVIIKSLNSKDYLEILEDKERNVTKKIKALKRSQI